MKIIRRIVPAFFITLMTLLISQTLFGVVMHMEKDRCWQELSATAQTVNREITNKFRDELVKLHLLEYFMLEDGVFDADEIDQLHIDSFQPTTMFSRIDVLYRDNTLVSNGIEQRIHETVDFDAVAAGGEYLTTRKTDFLTGRECVYYVLPVVQEEEVLAILIACIDSGSLSRIFRPLIYSGQANICIVDTRDGSFVMDSWHETLGNAYDIGEHRQMLPEYEDYDWIQSLKEKQTGSVAFYSETTGNPLYMYFTPMGLFDWHLCLFVEETVLFQNTFFLRKLFLFAGISEIILMLVYFLINYNAIRKLEQSNREIELQRQQLHFISYRDPLTALYNRNKYTEDWEAIRHLPAKQTGVAFVDMNGLKQLNDTRSHEAGDEYLRRAAQVMAEAFPEGSYRIGGDEFVILAPGMDQQVFLDKIDAMQTNMRQAQVSISIGYLWEICCTDIDGLMKQAEAKMYQEKRRYYAENGGRR